MSRINDISSMLGRLDERTEKLPELYADVAALKSDMATVQKTLSEVVPTVGEVKTWKQWAKGAVMVAPFFGIDLLARWTGWFR